MQVVKDIAPYATLAGAALAVTFLVLVIVLWVKVRRMRRAQTLILGHHEARDIVGHVIDLDGQVRNLREAVELLTDELDRHKSQLDRSLTNRAIVRYDAFRDAGGEQSASFALLDSHRSGVVFSAIAARDFARIYVKHLNDGVADRDLSPEEAQAVKAAVPRPLQPGEAGPRAARAPQPPADQRRSPDERPPDGAPRAPQPAPDIEVKAQPSPGGGAPARPAPPSRPVRDNLDDFTWDLGDTRPADTGAAPGDAGPDA